MPDPALPERPPFILRARLLTPLGVGGSAWESDGALEVDQRGILAYVGEWSAWQRERERSRALGSGASLIPEAPVIDLRPWLLLPGLVDLHIHLPQFPSAGLGAGLDLLTWLERYIFPLERGYDVAAAERLAPAIFRALARAGTTTVVAYGAIWHDSLDATFRAAEQHGIRAVIGKVMMDRVTYDDGLPRDQILDLSLRQSADLAARWHGRDDGRLSYAFTPRFAVSCSAEMLRESAALAKQTGAYWQTHLSEDRAETERVLSLFPGATDYLDVYDRAGALGERSIFAHAIYLSEREIGRLVESGSRVAHCPASNMFLASGVMPLARYAEAGMVVGLGSDVAAAPDASIFTQMGTGFYAQNALKVTTGDTRPILDPMGWLRKGSLDGARALGMDDKIGSLEAVKEADLIAVDPSLTAPLPDGAPDDDPAALMSRLIFRSHPEMVRGAWVRGRLLPT
jgi:guanine deaminase